MDVDDREGETSDDVEYLSIDNAYFSLLRRCVDDVNGRLMSRASLERRDGDLRTSMAGVVVSPSSKDNVQAYVHLHKHNNPSDYNTVLASKRCKMRSNSE